MLDKRVGMNWFEVGNPYKCDYTHCGCDDCVSGHTDDDYETFNNEEDYLETLKQRGYIVNE